MTSFVWNLFKINDPSESTAICIPFGKQISKGSNNSGQNSFSTTPLHHAKKFHLKLYEEEIYLLFKKMNTLKFVF